MNLKQWLFLWGPVILWCSVIFAFSSIPTLPKVGFIWWDFIIKKTAHIAEYAILFFLIWRAVKASFKLQVVSGKIFLGILLFCLTYAISDELHQSFVTGRTAAARDVGFDLIGMILSWQFITRRKSSMV